MRLIDGFKRWGVDVPAGFETDGATIPKWLFIVGLIIVGAGHLLFNEWAILAGVLVAGMPFLFPNIGRYFKAAVVHDFLVQNYKSPRFETVTIADKIFYKALKSLGISFTRRWSMFIAVRVFGIIRWSLNR